VSGSAYDSFDDPYCYKGSFVLKNRAGLRDPDALEGFELEMSSIRAEEPLPEGNFDPAHYCAVHRHLFQDVYVWAGKYRTVRTAKDGNSFCYPEHIGSQMDGLFERLNDAAFLPGVPRAAFAEAAAHFLGELNAIHAFREGNGRTQLSYLHLIGLRAGHPLDLARVQAEPMLAAMIDSFHGKFAALEVEIQRLLID
jgi:cell filamentation protein